MAAKNKKSARRDILSEETNSNPYAPPKAQVLDPVEPPVERPRRVTVAMLLLCVSAASGAIATLILDPTKIVAQGLFPIGVTVGLCLAIWARRNWARWVYTALIVLTWLAVITDLTVFLRTPLTGPRIIASAGNVLEGCALVLLFTGPVNRWFRQRPSLQRRVD